MTSSESLAGRVALVTGAVKGIGAACVLALADAVVFVACADAAMITGASLRVDGGWTAS